MKKQILLLGCVALALVAALTSCKKDDSGDKTFHPKLPIRGAASAEAIPGKGDAAADLARMNWIVKYSYAIYNTSDGGGIIPNHKPLDQVGSRDTVNGKFILYNEEVISFLENKPMLGLILQGSDRVVVMMIDRHGTPYNLWPDADNSSFDVNAYSYDTVAYIPNSIVNPMKKAVLEAMQREDYEECQRLFDENFYFIPITGAEWRALKAEGKN